MKPIIYANDYQIVYFNEHDDEIHQEVLSTSFHEAETIAKQYPCHSYRIMRCLTNTKYTKWKPKEPTHA